MGNEGFFELGLLDVEGRKARDPKTTVEFFQARTRTAIGRPLHFHFPPARRFKLPAYPQGQNMYCEISPSRFHLRTSGIFTLAHGETIRRELTVLRRART